MIDYVPQAQTQSDGVLSGLFFGICLLPAIGSLIRLGFMSRFTFTEEKHAEICRLLAERQHEKAQQREGEENLARPATVN
jgi:Na+/melibiose symporter-like transporter